MGVVIGFLASIAGCKQGLGERCQIRSDCASGLACVLPPGATCLLGGSCQPETTTEHHCIRDDDCGAGLFCATSADCTESGARVCTATTDLAMPPPDLAAGSDLKIADAALAPTDG